MGTQVDGKPAPTGLWSRPETVTFEGHTIKAPQTFDGDGSFSLPTTPANAIDIHIKSENGEMAVIRGIFSLEGDSLRIRLPVEKLEDPRPTGFDTGPGDGTTTFVFERIKLGEVRPETVGEQLGSILWDARHVADRERLAVRCLKLAENHPGTQQAIVALLWAVFNAPDGPSGKAALASLKDGGIAGADLDTITMSTGMGSSYIAPGNIPNDIKHELAPLLLARVRSAPDHPKAAAVLSTVCLYTRSHGSPEVSPVFDEAARMITDRWMTSPDLTHFLETLSAVCQQPWAGRYEPTVRAIRDQSPDSYMRHRAAYTLAKLVAEAGEARQKEARELYVRFVKEADPAGVDEAVRGLVEEMVELSRWEIDAMLVRGIGGPAALRGVDLDGKPMDLNEFRRKVVLLSFWASWCGPCMKLIPHERALQEQYRDRPFALVGVNGDDIDKLDRKLLATHKITWRSFQNERPNQKTIGREWGMTAWPELYLIDHTGTIRRRWIGTPPGNELDREVERWVAVAEGKPLAPTSRPAYVSVDALETLFRIPRDMNFLKEYYNNQ